MIYKKIILSLLTVSALNAGWMDSLSQGFDMAKESGLLNQETTTKDTPKLEESKKTESTGIDSIVSSLSNKDMNGALKEALSKGVSFAIESLGKENGYMNNALTKIALPENLQKTADLVRKAGGDKYVDDLILAINNAASEAAPKTAAIFSKSISDMSIEDAKKILAGDNTAATDYFRENTGKDLQATIAPIIEKSMQNNDVAKYYDTLQSFYKEHGGILKNEYVSSAASMFGYGGLIPSDEDEDINGFITNKSIDGMMLMIEEEEKKIRDNPLMQNNELLGKVFSVFK